MKITSNNFKDLLIFQSNHFYDSRGFFRELMIQKKIKKKLIFTVVSKSKKNVLRGLHMQKKFQQGKFLSVIKGKILDVVIDCRKKSRTFGKHFKIILSQKNSKSIYIPPGFAHGFCGLEKENYVIYSCTNYRDKSSEVTIDINDKNLNIKWPLRKQVVSKKDKNGISFLNFKKKYSI